MSSLLSRLLVVALAGGVSAAVFAADAPKAAAPAAAAKPAAAPAAPAPAAPAAAPVAAPKAVDLTSPVGLWRQVDDETKKVQSLIRITESGGVLSGKIEKLMDPTAQNNKCDECPDDDPRKGKPILGMTIIKDMKKDGDGWAGGTILKASNGKIYKCEIKLADGGKKLDVRGKLGPFGKTQTWERAE